MTRHVYSLLWWISLPLVLGRLWWRGRREPGYRANWRERLGRYGAQPDPGAALWLHAVSVGETRAAEPLVEALLAACPELRIVLTHMTPTGRATGRALFAHHGARLVQCYLPYDTTALVARFIAHFRPRLCILMETEVWPNLIYQCGRDSVVIALVNARLSERSLRRGQRCGALIRDAARAITLVAAQSEADAARIASLGAPRVNVTGSIKFDVRVPESAADAGAALRVHMGGRCVLLCASTREGEEALLLDAFVGTDFGPRQPLLVIVPRHPQRFDEVAALIAAHALTMARRSTPGAGDASAQVLLGDTMGEMFVYYAACDCTYIGGSLLALGGQNLIEACALGKPVLVGPHTFNFALASEQAITAGAAIRVDDAVALMAQAALLLGDSALRADMGQRARRFAQAHGGATARTLALLMPLI